MALRERGGWMSPPVAAFMVGLWLPLCLVTMGLRMWSVHWTFLGENLETKKALFSLLFPSLATMLALAMLGLLLFRLVKERPWQERLAVLCAQIVIVSWACLEFVAFNFYNVTGSVLDMDLFVYAIKRSRETYELVNDSTPIYVKLGIGLFAIFALALPWGVQAYWRRDMDRFEPSMPKTTGLLVGLAITSALAIGWPMLDIGVSANNSRNAVLTIIGSAFGGSDVEGDALAVGFDTREASLERVEGKKPRNVVIILLESTRASATSLHPPHLKTTPFLEELSATSFTARRANTIMPHTSKALVSTTCGIPPFLGLPINEALDVGIPGKCLPRLFGEAGYETAFFQAATQRFESRPSLVKNMGFEHFYPLEKLGSKKGFHKVNYFGREDNIMLEPSKKWLEKLPKDKPFMLTYLTLTPHHDYLAPRRYGFQDYHEEDEFNRYLNAVNYVDHFVKNVFDMFKEQGLYEDTIFVILGDHGEGFGEHKRSQHDNVIYQEGLHIPLIIHDPQRVSEARWIEPRTSQLDIAPTVVEMSNHELVGGNFPGENMLTLERERDLFAHCWYERRCMAIFRDDRKYIYHFGSQAPELFDLSADPLEKKSIYDGEEGVKREHDALMAWRANVNALYDAHQREYARAFASTEKPESEQPRDIRIGDLARVVGVTVKPANAKQAELMKGKPLRPGQEVVVETVFESLAETEEEWKLFMHGETTKKKLKNLDHVPVAGAFPIKRWEKGTYITDRHKFRIPGNARGSYKILVGIYHDKKGRLVVHADPPPKDRRALLVEIPLSR